jgi:hypothetical protein
MATMVLTNVISPARRFLTARELFEDNYLYADGGFAVRLTIFNVTLKKSRSPYWNFSMKSTAK